MHRLALVALAAAAGFASCAVFAQQPETSYRSAARHVTWSFDPIRGTMQAHVPDPIVLEGPSPALAAPATISAGTNYTGTIEIDFTVNLVSPVPRGSELLCSAAAGLEYSVTEKPNPDLTIEGIYILDASQSFDATVSGTTATCRFSIPYSWLLPASTATSKIAVQGITGTAAISEIVVDKDLTGVVSTRSARSTGAFVNGPTTVLPDAGTISLAASAVM
jgi:hypothetical protein